VTLDKGYSDNHNYALMQLVIAALLLFVSMGWP